MLYIKFNQDLATQYFKQKIDSFEMQYLNYKVCLRLNYLTIFKAVPKTIDRRTHRNKIKKPC